MKTNQLTKTQARGFTLIEVMVALVITVAAALLLTNAWSGNYLRVRKTILYNNVASLLERKAVEMETKYKDKRAEEIKDEEGDFGKDFPQYRWSFTAQPFEMPDLAAIVMAGKSEGVDQLLLTVLGKMQETIAKAVVEATVTVYVKSGIKETPYSITTYFVDYETEPELSL